jgi:hypothetical protein
VNLSPLEVVTVEPDEHEFELEELDELPELPVLPLLPPRRDPRKDARAKFTIVESPPLIRLLLKTNVVRLTRVWIQTRERIK